MKIIEIAHAQTISDAPRLAEVGYNTLQFLLRLFGIIAIIGLVISGIIYLTARGDEEQIKFAKKSFIYSIIGISVALISLIVVRQIIGILL